MYRGNWGQALLSRALAVAVLCLAAAWLAGVLGEAERDHTGQMTHEELKAHVREGADAPFGERYLTSLLALAAVVTLSEGLAGALRAVVPSGNHRANGPTLR